MSDKAPYIFVMARHTDGSKEKFQIWDCDDPHQAIEEVRTHVPGVKAVLALVEIQVGTP